MAHSQIHVSSRRVRGAMQLFELRRNIPHLPELKSLHFRAVGLLSSSVLPQLRTLIAEVWWPGMMQIAVFHPAHLLRL